MHIRSSIARRRLARAVCAGLAVAALTAPAAGARLAVDQEPGVPITRVDVNRQVLDVPAPTVTRTVDEGFDWGSAAIGAGGAGALLLLAAAGSTALSRHHRSPRIAP